MYSHALALHTTRKPDSSWDGTFWRVNLVQLFRNKQEHSLSNCSTVHSKRVLSSMLACCSVCLVLISKWNIGTPYNPLQLAVKQGKSRLGATRSFRSFGWHSVALHRQGLQFKTVFTLRFKPFPCELAANVWALLRVFPLREAQKQLVSPYFDWLDRCRPGYPRYRHHDSKWRRVLHHFPPAAASAEISPSLSVGDGIRSISSKTLRCD